jgi:transposase InsO family protein
VKYAFMRKHQNEFRLRSMCRVLQVSASGYYAWLARPESRRASEDRELVRHIQRIHSRSRQAYGTLKVHCALQDEGVACGKHRIARLRREHGIQTRRRRRFVVTTRSKHRHWIAPNLLQRSFTAEAPNRIWVGDVTFIATRGGWLYLAVLLDLYSRKVVGWSMGERNDVQTVQAALRMAIEHRQPAPGLIHHTDRGTLYAADGYRSLMSDHGMVPSMSRKKDCWDNAVAESFFATLKNELLHGRDYRTRDQARTEVFEYIEVFYNRQRIHQTLGYHSPLAFEAIADVA